MSIWIRTIIVVIAFFLFVILFKKTSGSLSLKRLNITNIAFYYLLFFCMIGGSLIFLGFKNHYLVQKIRSDTVIIKGYIILLIGVLGLAVGQLIFNRLSGINNYKEFYDGYVKKSVVLDLKSTKSMFTITFILTLVSTLAVIYTFYVIGFVSLFEIIKGNFGLASMRIAVSRDFTGNQYIRNIFALGMTPILSYLSYIYWRQTKQLKWKYLFIYLLVLSLLCKTYDFEKAPVIIYILYFYVIETMMGEIKNLKKAIRIGVLAIGIILISYYLIMGYEGELLSVSNGPLSRIIITQIATLFLHVQLFPAHYGFLYGKSFPKTFTFIFGLSESGIRSGRVVMESYNAYAVSNNTAGVMNSIYVAEAYANWGWYGVIFAPLIVSFFLSVIPNYILKQEKNPLNMTIYILFVTTYTNSIVGGFVDFIYNVYLIVMVLLLVLCKVIIQKGKIYIFI